MANALGPIVSTLAGIVIVSRLLLANAYVPISVRPVGSVNEVMLFEREPLNACCPIVAIVLGIERDVMAFAATLLEKA